MLAAPASAQHLRGRVTDAGTGAGIYAVRLDLLSGGKAVGTAVSDSIGQFALTPPRSGRFELRAARLGYAPTVIPSLEIAAAETVEIVLVLAVTAIPLEPLKVVSRGRTLSSYLDQVGFYERETQGVGSFLSRYEIEKRGGTLLSDLLRTVSGVRLVRADRIGTRWEIRLRNRRCAPGIVIDGAIARLGGPPRPTDMPIDDLVSTSDIEGIELYHGASETPAAFNREANCGVIVIWTRRRR